MSHDTCRKRRAGRSLRVAAVLVLGALSLTQVDGAAAADEPAAAHHWSVTRVAGGFRVTLDLDKPLPMTAGVPTLSADGTLLGPATESADGTLLSLVTTDPSVLHATSVTTDAVTTPSDTGPASPAHPPAAPEAPEASKTLSVDPSEPGPHHVSEAVYDFGDEAIPLLNIGGVRGELKGKVYLPDGTGRKPVVIFEHGRHTPCYGPDEPNPAGWPCRTSPDSTEQVWPIPSFEGYDAPARALASNGYAVISVSANAINATDNQLAADYGAQARGELILDTLRMLKKADAQENVVYHDAFTDRDVSLAQALDGDITPSDLAGKLDLQDVGIMGHSRGGEGVVAAATLNDALPVSDQFGIKAVLPLAPVDYDRISLPNAATATVLPYCDGDVENLMGQHIVDDSRHAFDDNVLRSAVLVMGTNHNFFNTIWTPGGFPAETADDWTTLAPNADDPVCDPSSATTTRLTPQQQVAVGTAYVSGFFRLTLGEEEQFQPMFDGSDAIPPSTSFAHISVAATQPAKSRVDIATFEHASDAVGTTGDATAEVCESMGGTGGVTLEQPLPFCSTTLNEAAVPHWSPALWAWNVPASPMLHMKWTSASGQVSVAVPADARDVSSFQQVSVKMAADEAVATGTDLAVTVADGSGHTWSSPVSALNPAAVTRMPGVSSPWLRKVILQQVTIPTSALEGLNLKDVREVRFSATKDAPSGGVYLSDLSVEDRAVGARVPEQQAGVDVAPARVDEGSGSGTAEVAAVLSRPVDHPVTAYVSAFGAVDGRAGDAMHEVTFAPGQVCVAVRVPTYGDTQRSATATTSFKVSATDVSGAVMGDKGFGTLTVREDDGVIAGDPAPEFGVPGDACAEYAASRTPGTLDVDGTVTAGTTTPVTARGYRSGESVEFRLGEVTLGRAVADSDGTVTFTARIPADTPVGATTLTATGAGSAHSDTATVQVRAAG
ncbi:hypothetical protein [Streptomyces odontomachi]|uniref:hypothetical protein n=1 Tax=Streptomyces odontomachi TaxID=2944940 RepID=UPI0021091800|nr:hypothetical protein [Streptomyces sp. ODS25]